jgi:hypothetical protein
MARPSSETEAVVPDRLAVSPGSATRSRSRPETEPSDPTYEASSPAPSLWQAIGSVIWNTISGIAEAVTKIVSVVWNALAAAEAYIDEATAWLSSHLGLGKLANQLASGLKTVASAMEWAWTRLTGIVANGVRLLLGPLLDPILNSMDTYEQNLATNLQQAGTDYSADRPVAPDPAEFWQNVSGPVFYFALGTAVALTVAIRLVDAMSLGAGLLIPIIVGLIIVGASAAIADRGGSLICGSVQRHRSDVIGGRERTEESDRLDSDY